MKARDATAHSERYQRLRAVGEPELLLAYSDIQRELHGDCFYHGNCPSERVARLLRAAEGFPARLEAVLRQRRRGP